MPESLPMNHKINTEQLKSLGWHVIVKAYGIFLCRLTRKTRRPHPAVIELLSDHWSRSKERDFVSGGPEGTTRKIPTPWVLRVRQSERKEFRDIHYQSIEQASKALFRAAIKHPFQGHK